MICIQVLRFFTFIALLIQFVVVVWCLKELLSTSVFGYDLTTIMCSICGYSLLNVIVGICGCYLCYRTVLTTHVILTVIFIVLISISAYLVIQTSNELSVNTVTTNSSNAMNVTEYVNSVSTITKLFLTNLENGYQNAPIATEENLECCGYMTRRLDCSGLLNASATTRTNTSVSNATAISWREMSSVPTCSNVVISNLSETMNEGDEIMYVMFLLFMDLILSISMIIGANSNKYKVDLDALEIIKRIEDQINSDPQMKIAVSVIQGFYRRWKAKNLARRRMFYLLWVKHSERRWWMSLVVYFLAVVYSVLMVFVILIFGIKFEPEVVNEWLLVCGWATLMDVIIQQPLSVLFATFVGQFDLGCFGDVLFELVCCGP